MKRKTLLVMAFSAFLIAAICLGSCSSLNGGTVIVTNNSNKSYSGRIWTDSEELFKGTIRAWDTEIFYVSDDCNVYTEFESSDGGKSNPSGHVSGGRSLILDL